MPMSFAEYLFQLPGFGASRPNGPDIPDRTPLRDVVDEANPHPSPYTAIQPLGTAPLYGGGLQYDYPGPPTFFGGPSPSLGLAPFEPSPYRAPPLPPEHYYPYPPPSPFPPDSLLDEIYRSLPRF